MSMNKAADIANAVSVTTAARPMSMAAILAWAFAALVVYASLYPFGGWSGPGIGLVDLLLSPLPQYWTWFDVLTNAVGYAPLGFLVTVAAWRTSSSVVSRSAALVLGVVVCGALSLGLEWSQSFLPGRIPSNVDWALNTAGGLLGSACAALAFQTTLIAKWDAWRHTWLVSGAKLDLVLLGLWPVAALYPSAVPFGLGHVRVPLSNLDVASWNAPSWLIGPLSDFHAWAARTLPAMTGLQEALVMGLSVCAPLLLACAAGRSARVRLWAAAVVLLSAFAVGAVSGALTYGPEHALDWWRPNMWLALVLVAGMSFVALWLSRSALLILLVLSSLLTLWLLNTSGASAYLDQSLQIWQAGPFIRFHGASQWLGWLWPFMALAYAAVRCWQR
ncbi:VanZ family protein [Comamonadaceae bacterium M7527]|nr:VanZ family protein [Comamonadaceae bacterium M7527]